MTNLQVLFACSCIFVLTGCGASPKAVPVPLERYEPMVANEPPPRSDLITIKVIGIRSRDRGVYVDLLVAGPENQAAGYAARVAAQISFIEEPISQIQLKTNEGQMVALSNAKTPRAVALFHADPSYRTPSQYVAFDDDRGYVVQSIMLRASQPLQSAEPYSIRIAEPHATESYDGVSVARDTQWHGFMVSR